MDNFFEMISTIILGAHLILRCCKIILCCLSHFSVAYMLSY